MKIEQFQFDSFVSRMRALHCSRFEIFTDDYGRVLVRYERSERYSRLDFIGYGI